jgi:hypothetical protein
MSQPDPRIIDFIGEHHILTLAVARNNIPYCATCYYAWLKEEQEFIFTSDHETRHIRDVVDGVNYRVAGTIALETKIIGKIRGIQFTGILQELTGDKLVTARARYLKRFPIARMMPGLHLWSLAPDLIKMTDNRLGFGKKLIWIAGDPVKTR